MLFKGHTISVVTDLNMLGPEINNVDFLTIAAITTGDYPRLPNIYNASILIPPTSILMAWADGDRLIMQNEYPKYLATKDPDDMIVALLAVLVKNNLVLYIPRDDFEVYGGIFLQYLYYNYGVTCNFVNSVFSIDMSKIGFIVSKFYMMDLMEPLEYIKCYPSNALLPAFVINKLAADLCPFNRPATFEEYVAYFNDLNRSKANTELKPMVRMVDKK